MYYLQSAIQQPLKKVFHESHVWTQRLLNNPEFSEETSYCHEFEKTLEGLYVYKKTLENK